jgi:hypothetical protein
LTSPLTNLHFSSPFQLTSVLQKPDMQVWYLPMQHIINFTTLLPQLQQLLIPLMIDSRWVIYPHSNWCYYLINHS